MYSIWSNIRFYAGMTIWLLITFAVFLVGWGMSFTSIDLSTAPKTTGVISSSAVKLTDSGRAGGVNSFVFQVNDLPDGYWIYRASGNYSSLYHSLKTGKRVTIYHSKTIQSNGLYTVYQLQDGDHIDYSKNEYEGKEKWGGRLIVLPGAVLLLIMIFVQIKKRRRQESSANNVE